MGCVEAIRQNVPCERFELFYRFESISVCELLHALSLMVMK